tara:strand:+ start:475 stop:1197 length:723 start_codon:yes stop_codon:yes gene_type:complete
MAYIGRQPAYGAFEKQSLTADGSTTTFSLNYTVGSSSSILVSVAGVHQEPEVAYNLSGGGTSIVFTAAPADGDTVFVVFLGISYDTGELFSSGSITSQTATTESAAADLFLTYDDSASALRKITNTNLTKTLDISGQTELSEQAADDDVLLLFDTSASAIKKIQKSNIATTLTYTSGTATGDGSTVGFTINSGRAVNDVLVLVNGVTLVPTTDYTISSTTLTFATAPAASAEIVFRYLPI